MNTDQSLLNLEKCREIFENVLKPGKKIFPEYAVFIPNPISLSEIREKLKSEYASTNDFRRTYVSPVQFAIDFRRVISNFLRYNWNDKSLQLHRNEARKLLYDFEDAFEEAFPMMCTSHPYIIHVLNAIEKACKIPGSANKQLGAAYPIMHSINAYSVDGYPYKYLDYIKKPMSLGQILGQIIERVAYANPPSSVASASKKSKKSTPVSSEVIITSATVPYYYYGNDLVDEILSDVDLLTSNIQKYAKAIEETPDEIVLKDANLVVASIHSQLDEYMGIAVGLGATTEPQTLPEAQTGLSLTVNLPSTTPPAKSRKSTSKSKAITTAAIVETAKTPTAPVSTGLKLTLGKTQSSSVVSNPTTNLLSVKDNIKGKATPSNSTPNVTPAPPPTSITLELASSIVVCNVLKAIFLDAISLVKAHYMMTKPPPLSSAANFVPFKVNTSLPFLKAVDPIQYPDYSTIVWNPMNLSAIEKKVMSNKYTSALQAHSQAGRCVSVSNGFLELDTKTDASADTNPTGMQYISAAIESIWNIRRDIRLIQSNAHLYNTGINGLEVRLMSDALVDYFEYVLRQSLLQLSQGYLYPSIGIMLHSIINTHNAGNITSSISAANIENNPNKLIATFNAIFYTWEEEGKIDAYSAKYKYIVDKDKRQLVPTKVLSDWLCISPPILEMTNASGSISTKSIIETNPVPIPASVSEYLAHSEAERVAKEGIEREKALQISKQKEQKIALALANTDNVTNNTVVTTSVVGNEFASLGGDDGLLDPLSPMGSPIPSSSANQVYLLDSVANKALRTKSKSKRKEKSFAEIENYPCEMEVQEEPPPPPAPLYETRDLNEWETAAINILKRLKKHDFIDTSRDKCISNYYVRVTSTDPDIARRLVAIDLLELHDMVRLGGSGDIPELSTPAEFYRKEKNESNYAKKVKKRSRYLIQLCKHLCLEKLLLVEDGKEEQDINVEQGTVDIVEDDLVPMELPFNKAVRDKYRSLRVKDYLQRFGSGGSVGNRGMHGDIHVKDIKMTECRTLVRDMARLSSKTANDKKIYSWFNVPVIELSDYAIYVREPMDISIILGKLDSGAYATYEAFLSDFRLVFDNAIAYNRVHMNTDPIGKSIYDKAMFCKDLLEELIHTIFSVDIAEKWGKIEIQEEENLEIRLKQNEIENKLMEEKREFFEKQQALLKQEDEAFAADLDREKKREETKRKLKELQQHEEEEEIACVREKDSKPPPRVIVSSSKELLPYAYFGELRKKWLGDVGHTLNELDEVVLKEDLPTNPPTTYFPITPVLLPGSFMNHDNPPPPPMGFPPPTPVYPTMGLNTLTMPSQIVNNNAINKNHTKDTDNDASTQQAASLAMVTMQHFPFSRTQELYLKYQVKRHRVRHRAWDIFLSRPGVICHTIVSKKTNIKSNIQHISNIDIDGSDISSKSAMLSTVKAEPEIPMNIEEN